MERPLNIPPDIWKTQYNNGVFEKKKKEEEKEVVLDDYTKLNNSIDMIAEGIELFKTTYEKLLLDEFSDEEKESLDKINIFFDQAIIPYTIKVIEEFNEINKENNK